VSASSAIPAKGCKLQLSLIVPWQLARFRTDFSRQKTKLSPKGPIGLVRQTEIISVAYDDGGPDEQSQGQGQHAARMNSSAPPFF
jgi:hypothetical protein